MPNYPLLKAGQQAVTASAVALPTAGPVNPFSGAVAGEGVQVVITALAANTIPIYYGPAGITTATGAELGPGASSPPMRLNNLNQIYVIASTTGAVVSYAVTNL